MSSTALTHYEPGAYLTQWREPEEVLAEATKAAIALKKVVSMKKSPVMFGGEQYLEREDWGTVAKFYGCTAKTIETRYVEFGGARGWEAVAVVIDRNMSEVGRAESMCLSDEEQWGEVAKYEWKDVLDDNGKKIWDANLRNGKGGYKSQKVKVGTTPKPLFQLRSMAATRAEAKALKGVFSWVVVLAGYQPTPAEEMTGNEQFEEHEDRDKKPPVQQPTRASEKKPEAQQAVQQQTTQAAEKPGEKVISGIIEGAKQSQAGSLWITVKGEPLAAVVDEKNIDGDMVVGNFIKFRGLLKWSEKLKTDKNPHGDFYSLVALIELSPVQEAEATKVEDGKLAPDASAVADEMFGKEKAAGDPAAGNAAIEDLKKNGAVTTAANLPAAKAGTIGKGRAQRLYAIATQNVKKTGFTEENIKKVLAAMYPGLAEYHLSDLEKSKYEWFEKLCTGEEAWSDVFE
jgi:hypothetical protein